MATYRKKPVTVVAYQFVRGDFKRLAAWCGGHLVWDNGSVFACRVPTLEGVMTARVGDWIIQGTKGEFYPCKPDIFPEIYEPLSVQKCA